MAASSSAVVPKRMGVLNSEDRGGRDFVLLALLDSTGAAFAGLALAADVL